LAKVINIKEHYCILGSVTRLGEIWPFGYYLLDHGQFKTWFVVLILTCSIRWIKMFRAVNLIFGIWAKVLAAFSKKWRFSFQSSGHSDSG